MCEREREREKYIQYVSGDVKSYVNKSNNDENTTGIDQDVSTYLEIEGTVWDQWEPMKRERGFGVIIIAW